ncbi:MAG: helix-turn-helix transcriptional regulator [Muricomes sp.]
MKNLDINNRIKYLRKNILHLRQEDFAPSIKISRSNLGSIEIGRINITDRVISDICERYNVSEDWLRDGTGEIFVPLTRSETISGFAASLIKNEEESFKRQLVEVLAELDEDEWKVLEGIAKKLSKKD